MGTKSIIAIGKSIIILVIITILFWNIDTGLLLGNGWEQLPNSPAPLLKPEKLIIGGFYHYSIIIQTTDGYYECEIFNKGTCTWVPAKLVGGEIANSYEVIPFSEGADCADGLPMVARIRWRNRPVAACATGRLWGEFSTYKVGVVTDPDGVIWVLYYGGMLSNLVCQPIPLFLPLLTTILIIGILESKQIAKRIRGKRKLVSS
jgi:hypothetical protein